MANTYIETSIGSTLDAGRTNTNDSLRAVLSNFSSTSPPTSSNFTAEGVNIDPPKGMLYYDEEIRALLIYDPDNKKDSPRGTNFTRSGLGIRIENGIAALAANIGTYEIGELVCTVSDDPNLSGNAAVYLITGNTNSMTSVVDISQRDLSDGDVTESILANSAVVTEKIQNDAVTGAKIPDDAIGNEHIQNDAVRNAQIGDDAVDTAQIADDAVENAQIANDAVDTAQIADDAVENAQIADDAVDTAQIADDAVEADQVADNIINTDHLNLGGAGSVGQILGSDADKSMSWVNRVERGTLRSTASGSSVEWTGIPSWVKRIEIAVDNVQTHAQGLIYLQLGDSGGYENSGYLSRAERLGSGASISETSQFIIAASTADINNRHKVGTITLLNVAGNTWVLSTLLFTTNGGPLFASGKKSLSNTLDRIKFFTSKNVHNFSDGQVNILYS